MIRTLPSHSLRYLAALDPPRPRVFVGTLSRTGIFCAVFETLSKGAVRFRRVRVCGRCRTLFPSWSIIGILCLRSTSTRSQRPQEPQSTTALLRLLRCVVRCGAGGRERVGATRVAMAHDARGSARASADSVLDGRLAGTGPSAHRVDSGPIGLRALLPM